MGTNEVAHRLPLLLAQPGQAPLVGFGVDPQHGLRDGAPVDLERPDQPPADVIEERIGHELLYGRLGIPLGVKVMRTRS